MFRPRVIPVLLLKNKGIVKTIHFKKDKATYIGDPINAVKIFNDKFADELVFLDIMASLNNNTINSELVRIIGGECNMPFSVGGGIRSIENIREILNAGAEKVIISTYAVENPEFIRIASDTFGSSSIVVCIDVKKKFLGRNKVFIYGGEKSSAYDPVDFAIKMEKMGCGEIIINSIDLDGTMQGYDIEMIKIISRSVSVPVIALGGAGSVNDFKMAIESGASAVAAGSFFVFRGKYRAVLFNFPGKEEIKELFGKFPHAIPTDQFTLISENKTI